MIDVKPLSPERMADARALFGTSPATEGCSCMWFLIPVKDYHANGAEGNRARFRELVEESVLPMGLLAFQDGEPVGWCAVGPRSRFDRALRVPSFKGRDPGEDETAWFVPCFYVRKDVRREGVAGALLEAAVALAREQGATAIEGFPFAEGAKLSRESMVGVEALFAARGFEPARRTSATRVVMRLELEG